MNEQALSDLIGAIGKMKEQVSDILFSLAAKVVPDKFSGELEKVKEFVDAVHDNTQTAKLAVAKLAIGSYIGGVTPDNVNWGHVGETGRAVQDLDGIMDSFGITAVPDKEVGEFVAGNELLSAYSANVAQIKGQVDVIDIHTGGLLGLDDKQVSPRENEQIVKPRFISEYEKAEELLSAYSAKPPMSDRQGEGNNASALLQEHAKDVKNLEHIMAENKTAISEYEKAEKRASEPSKKPSLADRKANARERINAQNKERGNEPKTQNKHQDER